MKIQNGIKGLFTKLFIVTLFLTLGFSGAIAQDDEAQAVEAAEESAASLYNSGLAMLKEKKYEEGYEKMMAALEKGTADENEKVVKLATKNGAVAAYSAGNVKLKEKDYEAAMTYYSSGIELNPAYESNYIGKGKVLNAQDDKMGAIDAYLEGARVAVESGKTKKEDEAYKRSKQIVGKFFAGKKYAEVIEAGNKISEQKSISDILYYVSRSQIETGAASDALETANKAIEVGEADGSLADKYYIAKGLALEKMNKTSDAIAAYKMVKTGDYVEQAEYKIKQLTEK